MSVRYMYPEWSKPRWFPDQEVIDTILAVVCPGWLLPGVLTFQHVLQPLPTSHSQVWIGDSLKDLLQWGHDLPALGWRFQLLHLWSHILDGDNENVVGRDLQERSQVEQTLHWTQVELWIYAHAADAIRTYNLHKPHSSHLLKCLVV